MLTNKAVEAAKPRETDYKLTDERGLSLLVMRTGGKLWRFRYRVDGREKMLSLGAYPDVGLAKARERRDEARKLVADGIDPSVKRKAERAAKEKARADVFELVAREWFEKNSPSWAESHSGRVLRRLEKHVFPWLGARPISEIQRADVLEVLERIQAQGAIESAHRALQSIGSIFDYAQSTGRFPDDRRNPTYRQSKALKKPTIRHHASITDPKRIGELLRAIDKYSGQPVTAAALRLAPLVFVRPGELRHAEWSEIDMDGAEWRIPAEKMKARAPHIVPLSTQALGVLRDIKPLTGDGRYVFPSLRGAGRPMSENTINAALRSLGYGQDEMTGHGFRSMASTLLNEGKAGTWRPDAIERQLAHAERDETRAAYNFAEHLAERRRMMQAWADYLDVLRAGNVVPLEREKMIA
jgi:integrase